MSRKDIIIVSVLVNAGLLTILLISALTTKESYLVASSAQVANTILETNEDGMLPVVKMEEKEPEVTQEPVIETPFVKLEEPEEIIHKLPVVISENKEKPKENRFMEITVKKGDTLEKIAKANHTSIPDIIKINELPNSFLRIGQTLLVPKIDLAKIPKAVPTKDIPQADYYTVKCGDNPWTIAIKHHLKVDELLRLNKLNNESAKKLRPGDKLRIR